MPNKPKKLIIDGIDYTKDSVFEHKITYGRSKDNAEGSRFIEKITFNNSAFDYINKTFFVDRDRKKEMLMQISPKNCDKTYNFKIGFRDVKKCDCSIECSPISDQADKYDYYKKTLWYGNGFDKAYEHFHVFFCQGFTFVNVLFTILYPILAAIIGLLNVIDSILDIGDIPTLDDLNELVSGCGNYHLGYSLLEVFAYHAMKNGQVFESAILQTDPYDKTIFVMADANNGFDDNKDEKFDYQNAYGTSVLALAQRFKKLHYAEFWIQGNKLRYEHMLVYKTVTTVLVDMATLNIPNCEQYDVSKGYAFGDFKYATDYLDQDGNQASDLYSDKVEWNSPPEPWQKGHLDWVIQDFSPIRYQQDKYDNNFWSMLVNQLRFTLKGRKHDMLLSNARSSQMKVFIWDGTSKRKDCRARKWQPEPGEDYYEYNFDYFINQNPLQDPKVKPNLYDRFLWFHDPRKYLFTEADDFEFTPCDFCEAIDLLEEDGTRSGILKDQIGMAEEITVNFDTQEVDVRKPEFMIKL